MILRPVSPQSPSGPPMKNLPGRVDVPDRVGGDPAGRESRLDVGTNEPCDVLGRQRFDDVLMGDDDLRRLDRLAVLIAHRHLALGVRAERLLDAGMAGLGNFLQDLVSVVERRRHQFRRLAAGVAEHDALVARALVLVAGGVDALRDIGRLGMEQHFDMGLAPVEPLLLVADVLDRLTGGLDNLLIGNAGSADFAGDDHPVGRGERLAGDADLVGIDARLGALAEKKIDDLVRNPVAHLVGMPFRHGFTGKLVIQTSHTDDLLQIRPCWEGRRLTRTSGAGALLAAVVRYVKPI